MSQDRPIDEDEFLDLTTVEANPNAEDIAYEREAQAELDDKMEQKKAQEAETEKEKELERATNHLKMQECFNCGLLFSKGEALEDGVGEEFSTTYCSLSCKNSDLDRMEDDKAAE